MTDKARTFAKLEVLLEDKDLEEVLKLLADFMTATELNAFYEHIKEELGI